jgi:hypothetical protein
MSKSERLVALPGGGVALAFDVFGRSTATRSPARSASTYAAVARPLDH